MSDIKVSLDLGGLTQYLDNFAKQVVKDVQKGLEGLAISTQAHIKKEAQKKLHSFRKKYLEALSPPKKIDSNTWMITLNSEATWIEEGIPEPYDMKIGLLNTERKGSTGKIHTTPDGKKYRVVPMNQAKTPSEISPNTAGYEQNMINRVKSELKREIFHIRSWRSILKPVAREPVSFIRWISIAIRREKGILRSSTESISISFPIRRLGRSKEKLPPSGPLPKIKQINGFILRLRLRTSS